MGLLMRRQAQRNVKDLRRSKDSRWVNSQRSCPSSSPAGSGVRCVRSTPTCVGKTPMNRLLQGDVGSGKTAVAAVAAYGLARSGFQSALDGADRAAGAAARRLDRCVAARASAHWPVDGLRLGARAPAPAALSPPVRSTCLWGPTLVAKPLDWKALALVMIDEQHRFGVEQRLTLRRGCAPEHGSTPTRLR